MTEPERDALRREDHTAIGQMLGMVRTLMQGQADHARITAERQQRQDDRIDRIIAEQSQQNRELVRSGKDTAELRGEVREMRQAFDERFDQLARSIKSTHPGLLMLIVGVVTAFVQFVGPVIAARILE